MGSLQRILTDLRKGGEGEDALRDYVELEVNMCMVPSSCDLQEGFISCANLNVRACRLEDQWGCRMQARQAMLLTSILSQLMCCQDFVRDSPTKPMSQVRDLTGEAFSRFMREVYDSIHARIRRSGLWLMLPIEC